MDIQWRHGCAKNKRVPPDGRPSLPASANCVRYHDRAPGKCSSSCGSTVVHLRSSAAGSTARTARRGMVGEWSSPDVKSRAGRRTVGIPHPVAHAIERPRERQAVERTRAGNLWREESWVCTNHLGGPVHPTVDYEAWKALLRRAKVQGDAQSRFPRSGWLEGSWGSVLVGVRGGWQSPAVPEFR